MAERHKMQVSHNDSRHRQFFSLFIIWFRGFKAENTKCNFLHVPNQRLLKADLFSQKMPEETQYKIAFVSVTLAVHVLVFSGSFFVYIVSI